MGERKLKKISIKKKVETKDILEGMFRILEIYFYWLIYEILIEKSIIFEIMFVIKFGY